VPGMETPHSDVEIARSATEPRVYLADSLLAAVQRAIALVLPHRPPIAATTIPTE